MGETWEPRLGEKNEKSLIYNAHIMGIIISAVGQQLHNGENGNLLLWLLVGHESKARASGFTTL